MKLVAVVSLLLLSMTRADECSDDDLNTISTVYTSALDSGGAVCPDATTDPNYCSTADCQQYMSNMIDELPDCSTNGVNVKQGLQAALDYCKTLSDGTTSSSGILSATSSDSALTSTSSTTDSTTPTANRITDATTAPGGAGGPNAATKAAVFTTAVITASALAAVYLL